MSSTEGLLALRDTAVAARAIGAVAIGRLVSGRSASGRRLSTTLLAKRLSYCRCFRSATIGSWLVADTDSWVYPVIGAGGALVLAWASCAARVSMIRNRS